MIVTCIECGQDVTALAPGEKKYQGWIQIRSDGSYHHVTCLHEVEVAQERELERKAEMRIAYEGR